MAITRLFSSADDADAAVAELVAEGFRSANIEIFSPGVNAFTLTSAGILSSNAPTYLAALAKGARLVLVHAPLGTAGTATEILGKKRSADIGDVTPQYEAELWDENAPLSSILKIPTVIDMPAIFSFWWNIPTLSDDRPAVQETSFGLPMISKNPTPLSGIFGLKLLAKNPAIFSSLVGLPTLI
jgi:hypothetical protein